MNDPSKAMTLKGLRIDRRMYGEDEGTYHGSVTIMSQAGQVDLVIGPEQAHLILMVCADALVDTAKQIASELTAQCVEIQPRLEGTKT